MPYTPPASSPSVSRNPSWSHDVLVSPETTSRPTLPRSASSGKYLAKHRRSPSITLPTLADNTRANMTLTTTRDAENLPTLTSSTNFSSQAQNTPTHTSLTAALLSPISSSETSDGDDTLRFRGRREVEETWNELEKAVRSISIRRSSSPIKRINILMTESEPVTSVASPSVLTKEARKIAHSRSSTETTVGFSASDPAIHISDDSDTETLRPKPNLLRKKSGELVKPAIRPSSRRRYSSMPGTPTYHKTVKFDDSGNETRHFLQVDKPIAISAGSSPAGEYESDQEYGFPEQTSHKMEWDIKLANFPGDHSNRRTKPVWVERFFISSDTKSLIGQVAVANLSFHKSVVARFTLDYWKTTSEVSADYVNDVRQQRMADSHDRFSFSIRLADQARLESKTLLLCIRYNVNGQELWDNNDGLNYQIDFIKKTPSLSRHVPQSTLGARPLNAIPRSRHSPSASHTATFARGRTPSIDDSIVSQFDSSPFQTAMSAKDLMEEDRPSSIRFRSRAVSSKLSPHGSPPKVARGLGGRYDFGASLSAALSTAQDRLGKQSGLSSDKTVRHSPSASYFSPQNIEADDGLQKPAMGKRPDSITTDRPAIGSAQYKDLVSKFCYFTPANTSVPKTTSSPVVSTKVTDAPMQTQKIDGSAQAELSNVAEPIGPTPEQETSSASSHQPSPMLDGTNDHFTFGSYSAPPSSAGPLDSHALASGSTSPTSFAYPFQRRSGYLSDSHTPTAIRG